MVGRESGWIGVIACHAAFTAKAHPRCASRLDLDLIASLVIGVARASATGSGCGKTPRVPTAQSTGTPSRGVSARKTALLLGAGAFLCLVAAPAAALTAGADVTPPVLPLATPAIDPPAAHLTLTQTVDKATAAVGDTVTYTVTVANTGSLAAAAVTVDDVMGGTAASRVDDGTAGTANSWLGTPVTTITKVLTGHYRWVYALMNPGNSNVVRFSAVIRRPSGSPPSTVTLTSTASTSGASPATATTTATLTPTVSGPSAGAVKGVIAAVPHGGSGLNATVAGLLSLGGVGCIMLAVLARRREDHAA